MRRLAITFAALATAGSSAAIPNIHATAPMPRRANETFISISSVHAFSNGRVLVLDNRAHRVVLLDSTLSKALIIDAVGAGSGVLTSPAVALAGLADTAFLVDLSDRVVSMINADGQLIGSSRNRDLRCALNTMGTAIQVVNPRMLYCQDIKTPNAATDGMSMSLSDSAAVVEWDIAHGSAREIASVQTGVLRLRGETMTKNCRFYRFLVPVYNPFPVVDYWRVLPDGNVLRIDGKSPRVSFLDAASGAWKNAGMLSTATVHASSNEMVVALERFKSSLELARRSAMERKGVISDTSTCIPPPGVIYSGMGGVSVEDAWLFASATQVPPIQTIALNDFGIEHSEVRAYETIVDGDEHLWVPLTGSMSETDRRYVVVAKSGQEVGTFTLQNGRRIVGFDQANRAIIAVPSADGRFTLERIAKPKTSVQADSLML